MMNPSSSTTKPLLITTGCSWTYQFEPSYLKNNITPWPNIVADFMDWDLINVGLGGAGNHYIYNSVIDAINKNPDREIIVFAFWSQSHRLNILDVANLTFNIFKPAGWVEEDLKEHKVKNKIQQMIRSFFGSLLRRPNLTEKKIFETIANYGLRDIWLLNEFCKDKNIKIVHDVALHPVIGVDWTMHTDVDLDRQRLYMENIENNWYYKEIKKWKNQVVDILDTETTAFTRYQDYYISHNDKHPNKQGHMLIAHSFINHYMKIYPSTTEASMPADFVYD